MYWFTVLSQYSVLMVAKERKTQPSLTLRLISPCGLSERTVDPSLVLTVGMTAVNLV